MNPFAVLGIPPSYELELKAVEEKVRQLSRALHPDKFISAGASERRVALSKAVEVNEAWRIVRNPIQRAEALFTLGGVAVGETREPAPGQAFLFEVMELREELADAKSNRDAQTLKRLASDVSRRLESTESALAAGFRAAHDDSSRLASIVPTLGQMRFWRRFLDEVSAIEDEMTN